MNLLLSYQWKLGTRKNSIPRSEFSSDQLILAESHLFTNMHRQHRKPLFQTFSPVPALSLQEEDCRRKKIRRNKHDSPTLILSHMDAFNGSRSPQRFLVPSQQNMPQGDRTSGHGKSPYDSGDGGTMNFTHAIYDLEFFTKNEPAGNTQKCIRKRPKISHKSN